MLAGFCVELSVRNMIFVGPNLQSNIGGIKRRKLYRFKNSINSIVGNIGPKLDNSGYASS